MNAAYWTIPTATISETNQLIYTTETVTLAYNEQPHGVVPYVKKETRAQDQGGMEGTAERYDEERGTSEISVQQNKVVGAA